MSGKSKRRSLALSTTLAATAAVAGFAPAARATNPSAPNWQPSVMDANGDFA